MNTSTLTVEKCEEMLSILKKVEKISNNNLSPSHQLALKCAIARGEEKAWKPFINQILIQGKEGYGEEIEKEVEPFISLIIQEMKKDWKLEIKLTLRCITIRDAEVSLVVYWKDHSFLSQKTLLNQTIVAIPHGYYCGPRKMRTRRPFIETSRDPWRGYVPHSRLLHLIHSAQKLYDLPPLTPLSTLYSSAESHHTLSYTSYSNRPRSLSSVEQFFPLFSQICNFLEGTPKEAVILQDKSASREGILLYPEGKYLSPDEYPVIEE